MTQFAARTELHRLYLKWMRPANSVEAMDTAQMVDSMRRELRFRRTIQPGSAIVAEIVEEFRFVLAVLSVWPTIGDATM